MANPEKWQWNRVAILKATKPQDNAYLPQLHKW